MVSDFFFRNPSYSRSRVQFGFKEISGIDSIQIFWEYMDT